MEVKLNIIGRTGPEGDEVEISTIGQMSKDPFGTYIEYQDESYGNTVSRIGVSGDIVTLSRIGDAVTTMVFEKGKSMQTDFMTPEGSFSVDLTTFEVQTSESEQDFKIKLEYTIGIQGVDSFNTLELVAQKQQEKRI